MRLCLCLPTDAEAPVLVVARSSSWQRALSTSRFRPSVRARRIEKPTQQLPNCRWPARRGRRTRGGDRRLRPFSPLRYRAVMRKTPTKLALRKETLRALSTINLTRVVGGQGDGTALAGDLTHEKVCNAAVALKP